MAGRSCSKMYHGYYTNCRRDAAIEFALERVNDVAKATYNSTMELVLGRLDEVGAGEGENANANV